MKTPFGASAGIVISGQRMESMVGSGRNGRTLLLITGILLVSTVMAMEDVKVPTSASCKDPQAFHCGDAQGQMDHCIDRNLTCNGISECRNGQDESVILCGCQLNEFQCNKTHCIALIRRCDRHEDCEDGADEAECETYICPETHIKCNNNFCIPRDFWCDYKDDCGDNSDEKTCMYPECYYSNWKCNNSQCLLSNANLCDGEQDCLDGSDEWDCDRHYIMANGLYVSAKHRCNGDLYYVGVLTDEQNCGPCQSDQYMCKNHRCIQEANICDGVCDCGYECDDEKNCPEVPCLSSDWFLCARTSRDWPRCVRHEFVCDGHGDCHDSALGQDESVCVMWDICRNRSIIDNRICDGIMDCHEGQDEANCSIGIVCRPGEFKCGSGACVPASARCNATFECNDLADEKNCDDAVCLEGYKKCTRSGQCVAEEFWCDWIRDCMDGSDESEDCPNRKAECGSDEFRCDNNQCIPNSEKCFRRKLPNGRLAGCADNSHLYRCKNFSCESHGWFKCRSSYCVLPSTVCDGTPDCIYAPTDEETCAYECPFPSTICKCKGIEMNCTDKGLSHIPDTSQELGLNKFILRGNNIGLTLSFHTFSNLSILTYLDLSNNNIHSLGSGFLRVLFRLQTINIADNLIESFENGAFSGLANLNTMYLRGNRIKRISQFAFTGLSALKALDLSHQQLEVVPENAFNGLRSLYTLDLSNNRIYMISDGALNGLDRLKLLDISNNHISIIGANVFNGQWSISRMYTDEFRFCCLAPAVSDCHPKPDEFSSCEDLMSNFVLRISIWVLGIISLFGNSLVIVWRLKDARDSKVHSFLITNLAIGDLLMGLYLLVIAAVDLYYRGVYSIYDKGWRDSGLCQFAGFLSTFSSELSVFTLTVITVDRFVAIIFPFTFKRLDMRDARIVMAFMWALVAILAVIPLFDIDYFDGFYGRSGVCLALHITNDKPNGWEYAVFIFLALNFVSFVAIITSYIWMFLVAKRTRAAARSPEMKKDHAMARRMTLIVLTDFCCWMPIILLGCASLGGATVPPQVFAWIAVFVLPLNAAVNPILYTLSTATFLGPARNKVFKFRPSFMSSVNGDNTRTFVFDDKSSGYEKIRYSTAAPSKRYQAIEMTAAIKRNSNDHNKKCQPTDDKNGMAHQYQTMASGSPECRGTLKPDVICLYDNDVGKGTSEKDNLTSV